MSEKRRLADEDAEKSQAIARLLKVLNQKRIRTTYIEGLIVAIKKQHPPDRRRARQLQRR